MSLKTSLSNMVLLPCSKIYGAVTYLRNKFFDWGLLKEVSFDVPVVVVGNLSAGGTGKTPHVEYVCSLFETTHHVAVLSRGYKRETKGFVMADDRSTPRDIGDESYQIYHKFEGRVRVAVCEDRVAGIRKLLEVDPKINFIVLDDAFQHRYVKPTVSIVVAEYRHPIYRDKLLPLGRLRESRRGLNRADILVVTKCPRSMRPFDYRVEERNYELFPYQHLYFSRFSYRPLRPVFPDNATSFPYLDYLTEKDYLLAVAGIGNPRPFVRYLKSFKAVVKVDVYPDHHYYTRKDFEHLLSRFRRLKGKQPIIVTTEKDAVRMANNPYFPHELKAVTYYLPVEIEMVDQLSTATTDLSLEEIIREKIRT